ncbi:uncharacterized protein LOC131504329 [Neofelis nebulosa]|uniref:uncharacterized protein LOC131504329 n=1 Tax=Neofelis nebulosa TaxID=61452 RepID=UPI00272B8472|nr:uncharacterized protein LOC131504329 [Neofelis nebulosa]
MGIQSNLPVLCPVRGKDSITTLCLVECGLHTRRILQAGTVPLALSSCALGRPCGTSGWTALSPGTHCPLPREGPPGRERSAVSGPRGWGAGERGGDSPGTTGRLKSWLWGSNRSACFSKPLSSSETENGPLCGRGPGAGGIPGPRQDPGSRTLPPAVRLKPVQLGERVEVQKGTPGRGRASRQGHTAFLSAAQLSPPWSVGAHPPAKGHGGPLSWTRISAARKPRQRHLPCEADSSFPLTSSFRHKTRQVKHPVEETQTSPKQ